MKEEPKGEEEEEMEHDGLPDEDVSMIELGGEDEGQEEEEEDGGEEQEHQEGEEEEEEPQEEKKKADDVEIIEINDGEDEADR